MPAAGASNLWTMEIRDSAQGGAVIGQYGLTFDNTRANGGTLASVTTLAGGAYNAANGTVTLNVAGGPLTITVGKPGDGDEFVAANAGWLMIADDVAERRHKKWVEYVW